MNVMSLSTRRLRLRRSRYAFSARRNAVLRSFPLPVKISLPGGRMWERRAYVFWRIRVPLWLVLGVVGWLLAGVVGILLGAAVAVLIEILFSYRRPGGLARPTMGGPPGSGPEPSGVREPRRPRPSSGAGSAFVDSPPAA
jgi:hypothetical protein